MAIKKRGDGEGEDRSKAAGGGARAGARPGTGARPSLKKATKSAAPEPKRTVRRVGGPRIRASHAGAEPSRPGRSSPPRPSDSQAGLTGPAIVAAAKAGRAAPLRKAPLAGPKRTAKRAAPPTETTQPEPSSEARELALALAGAGMEKKAIGIEILDVCGKVDYADFLVVMTGRSDRHVHAIATGIEDVMRRRKLAPLSMEGLSAATWVLIDFGDVVVHVFQEEARLLYDIEGLWIDASRVPVPADASPDAGAPKSPLGAP